ncbi:MAG: ABC transporter permease [Planctomycetota bacterium]
MGAYIIRRVLYTIPLVLGVCVFTFLLFDVAFPPRARAVQELGKHANEKQIQDLIRSRGWDKGLFWNRNVEGPTRLTDTRFANHMVKLLCFRFGRTKKTHEDIGRKILQGMVPSLTLTVPIFVLGLTLGICLSLGVAYFRATYLDLGAVVVCVAFMSVSVLVYIIAGQLLLAQYMRFFPIYGYAGGISSARFLLLPVLIAVVKGLGGDVRFYRTILLEEISRDYVRTARAKGLGEKVVLFKHVLKNAMIPVLTRTVLAIPFLFMGSLLLENFFGIPGLGNMTVEAVANGDTQVMAAMVYLGALLFALGNLLTDISYTLVDPRIRLR